jgi:predicted nucleic-acid-binding protein
VIALDTNVLVRFLVQDDDGQTARVQTLLQRAIDRGLSCYVSDVALCELVWVLERSYKIHREEIGQGLHQLLRARHLLFSSTDHLFRALEAYTSRRGDFADYVIREHARSAGCESVATFDKALLAEQGFMAP